MENKAPTKRKAISAKTRMEVFKRDSFTCQYCGRKAPDVVLHVDHIKPVAKGGKNDIMNYVTSCVECNLGKGARELSDDSVVEKSRRQAELLQERRAQIKMLSDWYLELAEQQNESLNAVDALYQVLNPGMKITEEYKRKTVAKLLSEFGLIHVLESLKAGTEVYGGDARKALEKLSGICARRAYPDINKRSSLLAKLGYKFWSFKKWEAAEILTAGYKKKGAEFFDRVEEICRGRDGYWRDVKDDLVAAINE